VVNVFGGLKTTIAANCPKGSHVSETCI